MGSTTVCKKDTTPKKYSRNFSTSWRGMITICQILSISWRMRNNSSIKSPFQTFSTKTPYYTAGCIATHSTDSRSLMSWKKWSSMTVSFWTFSRDPHKVKTINQVSPLLRNPPLLTDRKLTRLLLSRQVRKKSSTSLTNSSRSLWSPAEHTVVLWNHIYLSSKGKTL